MSGNLFKNFVSHYPLSSEKPVLQSWFFCLLIGEFQVKKVASIWFSFTFTVKAYKHLVLWWREHISQSKFKDDMKSKYWWCSKCYPEDREGECYDASIQSKSWCLFKNLSVVIWNMEMYSPFEIDIFLTQIKVRRRNNLTIMRMPF